MSGAPRIGCIGDLLVEFVCSGKNGHHRKVDTYSGPFPSGAAGIFIDQAARAGGTCIFVGAVGDDAFGQVVLDRLTEDGVDTRLIRTVTGVPTGSAFVGYNDDGSRDFVYNIVLSAAAQFGGGEATIAALAGFGVDVMHVSGSALSNPEMCAKVLRVCKALHGRGVKISFDPNVRKELMGNPAYFGAVRAMMEICSIFLPSEDDAAALFPGEELEGFAPKLLAQGMDHVVLKKGAHGSEAMSRAGDHVNLAGHKVEVRDPTGAGDCFCATFVTLIASGNYSLREVMERANAAGALAVTKVGPMEGNSHLVAIEAFLVAES
jgi:sugar/nucleoside kinase (ribokinase family)